MSLSIAPPQPEFSPQVLRILQLAAIEASANRSERGDKICPEHLLVAMLQDGSSIGYELISSMGLTVADIRAGRIVAAPK